MVVFSQFQTWWQQRQVLSFSPCFFTFFGTKHNASQTLIVLHIYFATEVFVRARVCEMATVEPLLQIAGVWSG